MKVFDRRARARQSADRSWAREIRPKRDHCQATTVPARSRRFI